MITAPQERDGCRVGIDLVAVSTIDEAVAAHGERYLRRIFTDHELECCRTPHGLSHESLAARWAAKEATIKVLRPPTHLPAWTTMEVRRQSDGSVAMELTATAADLADSAGISSLALSLTHEGPYAAAIVFALCPTTVAGPPGTSPGDRMPRSNPFARPFTRKERKEHAHA